MPSSRRNTRRGSRRGGASCNGTVSMKNAMARKNCFWERTANGMAKLMPKDVKKNNNFGYSGGASCNGTVSIKNAMAKKNCFWERTANGMAKLMPKDVKKNNNFGYSGGRRSRRASRRGGASCNGTVSMKNAMARKNCYWERTANGMAKLMPKDVKKNNNFGYSGGRRSRRASRRGGASCNGTVSMKNAMARKNCYWERTANGMAKLMPKTNIKNNTNAWSGGKKNRKNRGVFSTLYRPVSGLVRTAGNVAHSGLNTAYAVPATFAKGAKNTVRNTLNRFVSGANAIGQKTFSGVNRSIRSVFKGRKSRKSSRKNM